MFAFEQHKENSEFEKLPSTPALDYSLLEFTTRNIVASKNEIQQLL